MRLFDVLLLHEPSIALRHCKVHLASHNGIENPLDVYLAGNFDTWQSQQNNQNFRRSFVISLIKLEAPNTWLFVGLSRSISCTFSDRIGMYIYEMQNLGSCSALAGRLIVGFKRTGRQAYLNLENWAENIIVNELRSDRMKAREFPGFESVCLPKPVLDLIISQKISSWRAALSSVAGIYLIADTATGRLYVGSAVGEEGIWGRWAAYSKNGHGGNRDLREVLKAEGLNYASGFQFSVLEIADTHASRETLLERESHWKSVLLSRKHGLNAN